jgi:hypothetical protein
MAGRRTVFLSYLSGGRICNFDRTIRALKNGQRKLFFVLLLGIDKIALYKEST